MPTKSVKGCKHKTSRKREREMGGGVIHGSRGEKSTWCKSEKNKKKLDILLSTNAKVPCPLCQKVMVGRWNAGRDDKHGWVRCVESRLQRGALRSHVHRCPLSYVHNPSLHTCTV